MSALRAALTDLIDRVSRAGHDLALVGGLAVSAHTEPRFTRDVDLAVAVADDDAAEALVRRLVPPYRPLAAIEHDATGRLAAIRLGVGEGAGEVVADLLFASSTIEEEVVAEAEPLDVFPGVVVPVARVGHLIALKLLSRDARRPQDDADLIALLAVADAAERARATTALHRIVERGGARGRDLLSDWERVQREREPGS